jgi:nicotinamidase-related amidase
VDVQNDFMRPPDQGGRLYVTDLFDSSDPGAVMALPRIEEAVRWMQANCEVLVFTGDWHGYDDEEIDPDEPDPRAGTYPPHCMGRSDDPVERDGAEIVESIRPEDPIVLERTVTAEEAMNAGRRAVRERRPVFIRKNRFDVFEGNPATGAFLAALADEMGSEPVIYVAGVARDVCVTQAVDGFQRRGYETVAIRDATWGLGLESEKETLARWRVGGQVLTLAELEGRQAQR